MNSRETRFFLQLPCYGVLKLLIDLHESARYGPLAFVGLSATIDQKHLRSSAG